MFTTFMGNSPVMGRARYTLCDTQWVHDIYGRQPVMGVARYPSASRNTQWGHDIHDIHDIHGIHGFRPFFHSVLVAQSSVLFTQSSVL